MVIRAFDVVSLLVFAREASCSACFFSFLADVKTCRDTSLAPYAPQAHRRDARAYAQHSRAPNVEHTARPNVECSVHVFDCAYYGSLRIEGKNNGFGSFPSLKIDVCDCRLSDVVVMRFACNVKVDVVCKKKLTWCAK